MPNEELSTAVMAFLREHIQSVEQVEILGLVRNAAERAWTARDIDAALRRNERSIARRLAEFVRGGLLVKAGSAEEAYRYHPQTPELDAAAAETIRAYQMRPVLVIETIFKPADETAQRFADAFRLRPK